MKFTKMQGIGNDYIYIDCFKQIVEKPKELSIHLSNRHFGIGGDGIILICPSDVADCRMDIYNSDGSRAEMCGNGIRCVGKFMYDNGYIKNDLLTVETLSGVKAIKLVLKDGICTGAIVNMGAPILAPAKIPVIWNDDNMIDKEVCVGGITYNITCVSMGNPHAIIFTEEDVDDLQLAAIGPLFENHMIFPAKTNTEFVNVIDRNTLKMRVWERGAGETFGCGTGASAVAVAAILNDLCERDVTVMLKGGNLKITWDENSGHVFMEGPAVTVFHGEV